MIAPIVEYCGCSMLFCAFLCFFSGFAIILMGKREKKAGCFALFVFLVALDCCVALPHDATGMPAVLIVVLPDHTHQLFLKPISLLNGPIKLYCVWSNMLT